MPVFITARGDASRDVCDGGVQRREAYLKKYNLSPDDPINLLDVLKEYGVNDCLFLLGVPEKGSEKQAHFALMEYGAWLAQGTFNATQDLCLDLATQNLIVHAVAKRFNGVEHKGLLAQAHTKAQEWKASMTLPQHKALVEILVRLTLDRPLHDFVTKADEALSEWALLNGIAEHVANDRRLILTQLLQ